MRVPLEILEMILSHINMKRDRLKLRYVNKTFSELTLIPILFDRVAEREKSLTYGTGSSTWENCPQSLRHKYLYHLILHHQDPRFFTNLVRPVFAAQLAVLGIGLFDRVARHDAQVEWCRYFMHEHWNLGHVVAHTRCESIRKLDAFYDECEELNRPDLRVENDRKFLEICCAIVADDEEKVLDAFFGFMNGVDDVNICFGTTLLGFAVKWGSLRMVKTLLRSVRRTKRKHLYIYLRLADACEKDANDVTIALLDGLSGRYDTEKPGFAKELLRKAVYRGEKVLFDSVISWISATEKFPDRLGVLEYIIQVYLSHHGKADGFLNYPAPSRRAAESLGIDLTAPFFVGLDEEVEKVTFEEEVDAVDAVASTEGVHYRDSKAPKMKAWIRNMIACVHPKSRTRPEKERSQEKIEDEVQPEKIDPMPPTALFIAASKGMLFWVDWLLWAGADARHEPGELPLLHFAWQANKWKEVVILLTGHGWNPGRLALKSI